MKYIHYQQKPLKKLKTVAATVFSFFRGFPTVAATGGPRKKWPHSISPLPTAYGRSIHRQPQATGAGFAQDPRQTPLFRITSLLSE
jgi:hypothetical protein